MTAINIAVTNKGQLAHIVTDGALYRGYDRQGRLVGRVTKFRSVPHAGTVIFIRGTLKTIDPLLSHIDGCASFDDLVDAFQQKCLANRKVKFWRAYGSFFGRLAHGRERRHGVNRPHPFAAQFFFVGWSDRDKRVKAIKFDSESASPYAPEESDYWIAPGVVDWETCSRYFPSDRAAMDHTAWPKALLELMKHQRRVCLEMRNQDRVAGVRIPRGDAIGFHVVHTVVSGAGIQHRVIHRWDDKVGEPIGAST